MSQQTNHPSTSSAATGSGGRQVLEALKRYGPSTARELAGLLGVGPVVVRAHLRNLLAQGLVEHQTTRQAIGRPTRRFRLTCEAASHFPDQYARIATHLADALSAEAGSEALERTFSRWEDALFEKLDRELPPDPVARLRALAEHQSRYGFMASTDAGGEPALIERHCPIAELASRHPEICRHEAALFARLLGRPVTLASCQALGGSVCQFRLQSNLIPIEESPHHAGVPA